MAAAKRVMIATAALGLVVAGLTAQPAAAEPPWQQWYGMHCGGIQVDRCSWLDWDPGGRVRAGANTLDKVGGGNYSVAVTEVQVQVNAPFAGWTTIGGTTIGDYDGWHATWDGATSNPAGVWCGWQYRARAYHRWTGDSSGGEWIYSSAEVFC